MIGIDIARVKRWFYKTYDQFNNVNYRPEVELFSVTAHPDPKGGIEATFLITVFDTSNESVFWTRGSYSRRHYGGWEASETEHSPSE